MAAYTVIINDLAGREHYAKGYGAAGRSKFRACGPHRPRLVIRMREFATDGQPKLLALENLQTDTVRKIAIAANR